MSVWQITGDGDALAIGEPFHPCNQENIDINIILFNNEIYGLPKVSISTSQKVL